MGYDLHITRKENWTDTKGPAISEAEWRRAIEEDSELSFDTQTRVPMTDGEYVFAAWKGKAGAMGWYGGEVTATDPGKPLVRKMVQIAGRLGAKVQGDDGEIYDEEGEASEPDVSAASPLPPGLIGRIAGWFRHRRIVRENQAAAPKFRVGQRVKNFVGVKGTVIGVNLKANGGLGEVRVRYDT
ncbi:MAG TPA: hypothetical protein VH518_12345, partial [Tepidisphaeraceae bacterium]